MEDRKRILPLLPLRDIGVFPHMVVPLFIGRDRSIAALDASLAQDRLIFLAAQKDAATNEPGEEDIFRIGTVAHIVQILKLPDGTVKVLVAGRFRAKLPDTVAAHLPIKLLDKQAVLELPTARDQLEKLLALLEGEIEILEIEKKIRGRVKKQMERTQREFYLNEQMRAIQKELGPGDEGRTETGE